MSLPSAREIAAAVRAGRMRAETTVAAALDRIAERDGALNSFTAVLRKQALADARAVDAAVAAGTDPGPLAGVPFGVKDLFDVAGVVTLAGSKILKDRPAARADGPLVQRLKAAGAILVGCQTMDEFAYGFTTENAHYGATRNPHDPERVAGGSSGGSAAAVAAGLVSLSLGSDTNGSIRVPSSFCGIFGLKPTYGRLPRTGSYPFIHDLDHLGPFARSVGDLALGYDLLQGHDPDDAACADRPIEPSLPGLEDGVTGLRVGVLGGWFREGASAAALDAVDRVATALGGAVPVELADAKRARAAAFCMTAAAGASLHLANLKSRPHDFDPATRDRFFAGALLPAVVLERAQRFRRRFAEQARALFQSVDILLAPSTPDIAPFIGQKTMMLGGLEVPTRPNIGIYTQPISFIGLPVAAVPIWTASGLPIGVQVIAAPWREADALKVARFLEATGVVGVSPRATC